MNYNRPGFQRLLNDVESGLIDVVITKDLSRLGRDYIMTGYYTDIYFPSKNVRYIAVNDNIYTLHDNNDITPFKNILNDMYAKDISKKVKSAKRQRMKKGYYCAWQPPYGYNLSIIGAFIILIDLNLQIILIISKKSLIHKSIKKAKRFFIFLSLLSF